MKKRKIDKIIIHCSDTPDGPKPHVDAKWIRNIHVNENGWSDIGYHYVIKRNGDVERGRDINQSGAHCRGHNRTSVGVCLVGRKEFNYSQHGAMVKLCAQLIMAHGIDPEQIYWHRNFNSKKECPGLSDDSLLVLRASLARTF